MQTRHVTMCAVAAVVLLLTAPTGRADTITKSPDLGPLWQTLSTTGSYVYADSFVSPVSGPVTSIGLWLRNFGGDTSAQPIVFDVFGSSGSGLDSSNVIATTGQLTLDVTDTLSLFTASPTSSGNLVAGQTYWVAGDEVGLSGGGGLTTGGHTQNSQGIVDNGTFWYSDDPAGKSFDGPYNTPEMAFTVTIGNTAVPEPASLALLGAGIAGLGFIRRRRSAGERG